MQQIVYWRRMQRRMFLALALLCLLFAGCGTEEEAESHKRTEPEIETELSFMGKPMPDLAALQTQTHLTSIDLRGHAIPVEEIDALQTALPDCEILYSIALGDGNYACTAEQLRIDDLKAEELALLDRFPDLTLLDARGSDCVEALEAFAEEHPGLEVRWSIPIGSAWIDHDALWVDLSLAELPDTDTLIAGLNKLENATDVSLVGCTMTHADQALLRKTFPDIRFYWMVEVDGRQFKNTETRLDFNGVNFDGAEDLASVVDCFHDPQWVDVATHGFESEEMVALGERFPNTQFVWTVRIGSHIVRTDIEVFYGRSSSGDRLLRDEDLEPIRHCKNLKAVNLYRNMLSDLSPLSELENLEVLVLSNNKIKDLSPLASLKNLTYLEAHNNYIKDISPLQALTQLRDVNLMFNDIEDFSALEEMKGLQRAYLSRNEGLEDKTWQSKLEKSLPNTTLDFDDSNTRGWENHDRYDLLDRVWTSKQMEDLY